jgi:hypothetical protein
MGFKLGKLGANPIGRFTTPTVVVDPKVLILIDRSDAMRDFIEFGDGSQYRRIDLLKRSLLRLLQRITVKRPSLVSICHYRQGGLDARELTVSSVGELYDMDFDTQLPPFEDLVRLLGEIGPSGRLLLIYLTAATATDPFLAQAAYDKVVLELSGTEITLRIFALNSVGGIKDTHDLVYGHSLRDLDGEILREINGWQSNQDELIVENRTSPTQSGRRDTGCFVVLPLVQVEPYQVSLTQKAVQNAVQFHERLCALRYQVVPTFIVDEEALDELAPLLLESEEERTADEADPHRFVRLDLFGMYLPPDHEPGNHLKHLFRAVSNSWRYPLHTGMVLICLDRIMREAERLASSADSTRYRKEKDEEDFYDWLVDAIIVHEHGHAVSQEGIDSTLDDPYSTFVRWSYGNDRDARLRYRCVSEGLAEWAELDFVRQDPEIYDLVLAHARPGRISPWPYGEALKLEKRYSAGDYNDYRSLLTLFRRDFEQAYRLLQSW